MKICQHTNVLPHRSYRKLHLSKKILWLEGFVFIAIIIAMMYIYLIYGVNEFILYFHSQLKSYDTTSRLINIDIFTLQFYVLDMNYAYLRPITMLLWLIALFVGFFIILKQKLLPYNVSMWINFFIILTSIFVLYFLFFTEYFPYTLVQYTELYLTATFGFLFFSALIMLMVFLLVPMNSVLKFVIFIISVLYFMFFTMIRLALTLLLTTQISVIFAPVMFFTLYLDFFFFVSVYTYVLYWQAKQNKKMESLWKW